MKINVVGVQIDNISKTEVLNDIQNYIETGKPRYIVTPYSEMIVFAVNDPLYREVLNHADLSLPDGIGILWAAKYLSLKSNNLIQALWQIVFTGASIVFKPGYVRTVLKEQVVGSRLIYDVAKLAEEKNYSLALVGGEGNVSAQAAYELKKIYPGLKVKLALSGRPFDESLVREISDTNSDILCIAYSPPRQELWIAENLEKLNSRVVIGLGGTLDYLAGKRLPAPDFMHYMGLEWLWRLITQPWRLKRMWNAIPVFIWKVYKYKTYGNRSQS